MPTKNLTNVLTDEDVATIVSIIGQGAVDRAILAETNSQLEAWEAEARTLTANSYANEAVDVLVKAYTSNGDGTFTATPQTGIYSALHYRTKAGDSASAAAGSASSASSSASTAATKAGEASTSATNAQLKAWEAEAQRLTALSYAIEAEDVLVKHYTSDGDGTFTASNQTGIYSALHYRNKASVFNPANYEPVDTNIMRKNIAQVMQAQLTVKETKETVYNLTGTLIDPANGTIQYKALTINTTFTEALEAGQSITLHLTGGNLYTVTFPALTWVTAQGNVAPLQTANDVYVLWKEGTTLYCAYAGNAV